MENFFELTISIVNTNNKELLKDCLCSIYTTVKKHRYEVIVVDNFSADGSVEMVKDNFRKVTIIKNNVMLGYGECHNKSINIAQGKYILILNEDMIIKKNAIDLMIDRIEKDEKIGVLGCKLLNPDGSLQYSSCSKFPNIRQHFIDTLLPKKIGLKKSKHRRFMYFMDYETEQEVDIIQGSCMLIPKKIFYEVGVFDTRFFVYSEEDDLCKRIKNSGYKIIYFPKSEIVHIGGQTSKKMSHKMELIMIDSKIKFYKKHHNRIETMLFKIIYLCGNICRVLIWSAVIVVLKQNEKIYYKSNIIMNLKSIDFIRKNILK